MPFIIENQNKKINLEEIERMQNKTDEKQSDEVLKNLRITVRSVKMRKLISDIFRIVKAVYQVWFVDTKNRYETQLEIEKSIIEKYEMEKTL